MPRRGRKGKAGMLHGDLGTVEAQAQQMSRVEETMVAGVKRRRVLDWWEVARAEGKLSEPQYLAAIRFHEDYNSAGFTGYRSTWDIERVDGGTHNRSAENHARISINKAQEALRSPLASAVVWWCVGEAEPLQRASQRLSERFGNIDRQTLRGVLVAGLDTLAVHYGYQ